jgi:aminoglycoside phosphotransferase (APT) family kinase protein
MALVNKINAETAKRSLQSWLTLQLPDAANLSVENLHTPQDSGISAEIVMFEARWDSSAGSHRRDLVARVQPRTGGVWEQYDLSVEFDLMRQLHELTPVPLPEPMWFEQDESVLGAPFIVMSRVHGRTLADDPPYTAAGWFQDLTPDQRAMLWDNGLRTLATIHRVDVDEVGLAALATTIMGGTTIQAQIDSWQRFLAWSSKREHPIIDAAFDYLRKHAPATARRRLQWGDARPGNLMFNDDLSIAAVLDWELATIGDPEIDLAWWLFTFRDHTYGLGIPHPDGIPSAAETVSRYTELSGHQVKNLDYYEVFAATRLSVAMVRAARMLIDARLLPPDAPMADTNPAVRLLAELLGKEPPKGPAQGFIGNRRN